MPKLKYLLLYVFQEKIYFHQLAQSVRDAKCLNWKSLGSRDKSCIDGKVF